MNRPRPWRLHPPFTDTMYGESFLQDSSPTEVVLSILQTLGATTEMARFINLPTSGKDRGRYGIRASVA